MEKEVKDLVEVTAPKESFSGNTFTDLQLGAYKSGYVDSYDEAIQLLERHDITGKKGKYRWKDR